MSKEKQDSLKEQELKNYLEKRSNVPALKICLLCESYHMTLFAFIRSFSFNVYKVLEISYFVIFVYIDNNIIYLKAKHFSMNNVWSYYCCVLKRVNPCSTQQSVQSLKNISDFIITCLSSSNSYSLPLEQHITYK